MTASQTTLSAALLKRLAASENVLFSRYEIARTVWLLLKTDGYNISPPDSGLNRAKFSRILDPLISEGLLRSVPDFEERTFWTLLGQKLSDPRVVICASDPFVYVSHLSAMEFHGLTDRLPEKLYVSGPAPMDWRKFARQKMTSELGDELPAFLKAQLPVMKQQTPTHLYGRTIHKFSSIQSGAYRVYKDPNLRVSTLGRTFHDMLCEPMLCGGLMHVLQVFRQSGPKHFRLIADELDQRGSPINKVRAGYIFEVLCNITSPRIDQWLVEAKRGGSRKLDATQPYSEQFSDRWSLSINMTFPSEWTL